MARGRGNFIHKTICVASLRAQACALKDEFDGRSEAPFSCDVAHVADIERV